MGADRIRPRTANAQQKLAAQPQQLKRRAVASKYSTAGAGTYQNAFASQMPQQAHVARGGKYDDESEPEFKAAKRVQSADLLSKLKMSSLRKYCRVHKIPCEDQPKDKDQMLTPILFHWKRQVVDDKQVLKKFAVALHENSKREQE